MDQQFGINVYNYTEKITNILTDKFKGKRFGSEGAKVDDFMKFLFEKPLPEVHREKTLAPSKDNNKSESNYEREKYYTTPEKLKETLEEFGVAIIPSVIQGDELEGMRTGMWDYLEGITSQFERPIDRKDNKTWVEYLKLYPKHSMLLQQYQIGHAQYIWDLRQNEKVVNIFSQFWDVPNEDLLVSFDGASFHFPPEDTNRGWYRKTWYHTDQSYQRPDFECMQSWVTAYDVEEGDATLAFMEKSHIYHEEFQKEFSITDKSDWYKHTEEEQAFYSNKGCEEKRIKCPAGSMVFWDSRTIHCGTESTRKRENKKIRNVAYICMRPRSYASKASLKKKITALENIRTTSHWPDKPKLFAVNPRTYGGPLPNVKDIDPPILSELGKKLAGY